MSRVCKIPSIAMNNGLTSGQEITKLFSSQLAEVADGYSCRFVKGHIDSITGKISSPCLVISKGHKGLNFQETLPFQKALSQMGIISSKYGFSGKSIGDCFCDENGNFVIRLKDADMALASLRRNSFALALGNITVKESEFCRACGFKDGKIKGLPFVDRINFQEAAFRCNMR